MMKEKYWRHEEEMIFFFIFLHWYLSLFCQTFFLHRYASHNMFVMSKFWERFFFFLTWLTQGTSFLSPRAYAVMHRLHHKYSDTRKDPHSPIVVKDLIKMMLKTYEFYLDIVDRKKNFNDLEQDVPRWDSFENFADNNLTRAFFVILYCLFYLLFAPSLWFLSLVPIHAMMGPIHGAIVNWCGHKYGYRNYKLNDNSKNTLPIDVVTFGELLQNNHHRYPNHLCFSKRWYEIDFGYIVCLLFFKLQIIAPKKTF